MKKLMFFVFAFCWLGTAQAQLRFGVKMGLSSTDIKTETINLLDAGGAERLKLALGDANYGIHGGLVLQANIGAFVLQPELNFNSNTVQWKVTDVKNPGIVNQIFEERYTYLDIPVLLGFRFGPLRLNAGPQGHVFLNSASDLLEFTEYDQHFKDMEINWLGGAGLDIWRISVDLRYEGSLNKFGDHIRFAGKDYAFSNSPSRWLASVSFFMNSRK